MCSFIEQRNFQKKVNLLGIRANRNLQCQNALQRLPFGQRIHGDAHIGYGPYLHQQRLKEK